MTGNGLDPDPLEQTRDDRLLFGLRLVRQADPGAAALHQEHDGVGVLPDGEQTNGVIAGPESQSVGFACSLSVAPAHLDHQIIGGTFACRGNPRRVTTRREGRPIRRDHLVSSSPTIAASPSRHARRPSRSLAKRSLRRMSRPPSTPPSWRTAPPESGGPRPGASRRSPASHPSTARPAPRDTFHGTRNSGAGGYGTGRDG